MSNSIPTTINFTYILLENHIISPLSLYATTLFFSSLSGGRTYNIKCEYWVGAKKISDGEAILTPVQDGISSITVMMNTNYLNNNLQLNAGDVLQLKIIITKNNTGNQTIYITSSDSLLSAFIRNGGEITANQVYDVYNNKLTTQAIINYTKQNITDNSLLTANKTIVGAINELYNLLKP